MRAFNIEHLPRPKIDPEIIHGLKVECLDVEIGAGSGLHAIRYCQAEPNRTLVAIERTRNRSKQLLRRKHAHININNLIAVRADAVAFVAHYVPNSSVDRLFLLYPNPYPKPKQANLRWHNMSFMGVLRQKLKLDGTLIMATNLDWYAEEACEVMTSIWNFRLVENTEIQAQVIPRTHFEKKFLARGERCWNLVFKPNSNTI